MQAASTNVRVKRKDHLLDEKDPGDVQSCVGGGGEEAHGGGHQVPQPTREAGKGATYIKKHHAANLKKTVN